MTETQPETIWLVSDGARGIYTRSHALQVLREDWKTGLTKNQEKLCLLYPQSVRAQELLEKFMKEASFMDDNGFMWALHEDQDIFAVREDHEMEEGF